MPSCNVLRSPSSSFNIWSSLSAANSAARVNSSVLILPARHCLSSEPTGLPVGSLVIWHIKLFSSIRLFKRFIWVVLPLPSIPSKTMKCPFTLSVWVLHKINNPRHLLLLK